MVYEKFLEGNYHGIAGIAIRSVVHNLLGENVTGVDDASYVLHIYIFRLIAFTNHVFPEVDVFDTF